MAARVWGTPAQTMEHSGNVIPSLHTLRLCTVATTERASERALSHAKPTQTAHLIRRLPLPVHEIPLPEQQTVPETRSALRISGTCETLTRTSP